MIFLLSEPNQTDTLFFESNSELHYLNNYVDRIEEVDGITKFFDSTGHEVLPVQKAKDIKVKCATGGKHWRVMSFRTSLSYNHTKIQPNEETLIAFFEENKYLLAGDGIHNEKAIIDLFGIEIPIDFKEDSRNIAYGDYGESYKLELQRMLVMLKKKLPEGHFVHKINQETKYIDPKPRHSDGWHETFFRFDDAIDSVDKLSTQEKDLLVFFEERIPLLNGDGIDTKTKAILELGFEDFSEIRKTSEALKGKTSWISFCSKNYYFS